MAATLAVLAFATFRLALALWATRGVRSGLGTDEAFHLNLIEEIRRAGHRPVSTMRGYANLRRQTYPWLFHWLLSFVSPRHVLRTGHLFGTVTDVCLFAAIIFALTLSFPDDSRVIWMALAVVAGAPLLSRERTGKLTLRERPLGVLLGGLVFVLLAAAYQTHSPLAWACAALVGSSIFLASKFGTQAFVGHCLLTGMLLGDVRIVLVPPISLLLALVWSRRHVWRVLRSQARHLRLFWTDIYAGFDTVRERYSLKPVLEPVSFRTRRRRFGKLVRRHPVAVALTGLPLLILVPSWGMNPELRLSPSFELSLAWLGASAMLFVITSIGKLRIFGQAERYFDLGVPAYAMIAAAGIAREPSAGAIALVVAGVAGTVASFPPQRRSLREIDSLNHRLRAAFEWIAMNAPGERILTIPLNWANYAVRWSSADVCDPMGILLEGDAAHFRRLVADYPWPIESFERLAKDEGIRVVVGQRHPRLDHYDTHGFDLVFENEACLVFRRRPSLIV
jgi:hypothetical protein